MVERRGKEKIKTRREDHLIISKDVKKNRG